MTGEKEDTLLPWLEQHPVKGWVFYDPEGKTGAAYGLELPVGVLIGADRKLLGFDERIAASEETVSAALAGKITTTVQAGVRRMIRTTSAPEAGARGITGTTGRQDGGVRARNWGSTGWECSLRSLAT